MSPIALVLPLAAGFGYACGAVAIKRALGAGALVFGGHLQKRGHEQVRDEEARGRQKAHHLINVGLKAAVGRDVVIFEEPRLKQIHQSAEGCLGHCV